MDLSQLTPMIGIVLAAGLALAIGLEREFYAKAAGVRTYMLVGMGSAAFTVISKYGFLDTVMSDFSRFDGSRVAAQIVTGIGFLGAGLIFVRRDAVRGLTTAAGIWFVAAVGMAAGSGLYLIATLITVLYFIVMFGVRPIAARMPHARSTMRVYTIQYVDGRGVLRNIMESIAELGLKVADLRVLGRVQTENGWMQQVTLEVDGPSRAIADVKDELYKITGVDTVT